MITIELPGPDDAALVAKALLVASGRIPRQRLSLEARSRANEIAAEIRDGLNQQTTTPPREATDDRSR